ncbi:Phosphatidylglycerophosphatase GEP4, mitochondrial [Cyphellophora attinorum]|uniref:Phosphatidylglycerophosphatase GEP4, mitochondrial n=1 Tax=Cyphellophora attinorum TaxID=1664694 RepID=A0A0N0NI87_9EURO|nr:Phosphatidylglycerophosphatase GEP4, mitochondrial [Phialophora attinorum]KPI35551.1 Phosphatidylglycerophosphatase GEP4, mitochondrial [Phialophora attinorum]
MSTEAMPLFSNLPALRLTLAYVLTEPSSLLPHYTIPTLLQLPIPVSTVLGTSSRKPTIKALVLDKDNTICAPETAIVHSAYRKKIEEIKLAKKLETELGLPVLRQQPGRKKPLCGPDVLQYFRENGVTDDPAEIVFVGDRLATDVMVAREMGSWSIWCRDGWRSPEAPQQDHRGVFARIESSFESVMRERLGKAAPPPTARTRTT